MTFVLKNINAHGNIKKKVTNAQLAKKFRDLWVSKNVNNIKKADVVNLSTKGVKILKIMST